LVEPESVKEISPILQILIAIKDDFKKLIPQKGNEQ
jgi:hypothetical protein